MLFGGADFHRAEAVSRGDAGRLVGADAVDEMRQLAGVTIRAFALDHLFFFAFLEEAQRLVEAFVGEESNVISRLRMATPLQVNLQVRIAEVSRSFVRALGVNLTSIDSSSGFKFGIGQGRTGAIPEFNPGRSLGMGSQTIDRVFNPITGEIEELPGSTVKPISPGTTLGAFGKFLGLDVGAALDLAETQGLVTTLSQPNLTALSGETAEFLAGGEFPIPLSQGLGTTTIE